MRQFYRKQFLENDSFSKKHYCRNKQSVTINKQNKKQKIDDEVCQQIEKKVQEPSS